MNFDQSGSSATVSRPTAHRLESDVAFTLSDSDEYEDRTFQLSSDDEPRSRDEGISNMPVQISI